MTPQFMGQGMSSGVRDAHNLAWKLDAVLGKGADPKLIDTYRERAQAACEGDDRHLGENEGFRLDRESVPGRLA